MCNSCICVIPNPCKWKQQECKKRETYKVVKQRRAEIESSEAGRKRTNNQRPTSESWTRIYKSICKFGSICFHCIFEFTTTTSPESGTRTKFKVVNSNKLFCLKWNSSSFSSWGIQTYNVNERIQACKYYRTLVFTEGGSGLPTHMVTELFNLAT